MFRLRGKGGLGIVEAYIALALSAFGAATLFPLASEGVLAALAAQGHDPLTLWLTATVANTLGSVVNWGLGRFCARWSGRRWFPVKPTQLDRAAGWFGRWGLPSLLFAWLPVIGDPLTVAAGLLKVEPVRFTILVGVGKGARYAAVLAGAIALA